MADTPERFFSRWSRRKRAAAVTPPASVAAPQPSPPPALPAPESLTFDSDFTAFMHAKVDEGVRRAALRKLFGDPRFNVMDGLDTYIDDYSVEDPIPPALLAQLEHARTTLLAAQPDDETTAADVPPADIDAAA